MNKRGRRPEWGQPIKFKRTYRTRKERWSEVTVTYKPLSTEQIETNQKGIEAARSALKSA